MESTVWEWILSRGRLSPTQTKRAVATERVLKRVNSGCREGCSKGGGGGGSHKSLLYCTTMCSFCIGQTCRNCDSSDD